MTLENVTLGLLVILALLYFTASIISKSRWTLRKLSFLVLLLCVGGTASLVIRGEILSVDRFAVIIAACDTPSSELASVYNNLKESSSRIVFFPVTASADSSCLDLTQLEGASAAKKDQGYSVLEALDVTQVGPNPFTSVLQRAHDAAKNASIVSMFSRTSLVLLYWPNSSIWEDALDIPSKLFHDWLAAIGEAELLLVGDSKGKGSNQVKFAVNPNMIQQGRAIVDQDISAEIILEGAFSDSPSDTLVDLCFSIDQVLTVGKCLELKSKVGSVGSEDGAYSFIKDVPLVPTESGFASERSYPCIFDPGDVPPCSRSLDLIDLFVNHPIDSQLNNVFYTEGIFDFPSASAVNQGYRRIEVIVLKDERAVAPKVVNFVELGVRTQTWIIDGKKLLEDSWQMDTEPPAMELYKKAIALNSDRFSELQNFDSSCVFDYSRSSTIPATDTRWIECFSKSSSIVLTEPRLSLLEAIDNAAKSEGGIAGVIDKYGLSVLIVGPPDIPPGHSSENWLPARGEHVYASGIRQIIMVADASRLSAFPLQGNRASVEPFILGSSLTSQKLQIELINSISKNLHLSGVNLLTGYSETSPSELPFQLVGGVFDDTNPLRIYSESPLTVGGGEWSNNESSFKELIFGGQLDLRLQALQKSNSSDRLHYPDFSEEMRFQYNTVVVMFTTKVPQVSMDIPKGTKAFGDHHGNSGVLLADLNIMHSDDAYDSLSKLIEKGVKVLFVKVGSNATLSEEVRGHFGESWSSVENDLKTLNADVYQAEIKTLTDVDLHAAPIADKILKLMDHYQGKITRAWSGELIDSRIGKSSNAPVLVQKISAIAENNQVTHSMAPLFFQVEDTHRSTSGGVEYIDLGASGIEKSWPAMVARRIGRGRVVALAYSPFSSDIWLSDLDPARGAANFPACVGNSVAAGCVIPRWITELAEQIKASYRATPASSSSAQAKVSGLGVQRFIDIDQLTSNDLGDQKRIQLNRVWTSLDQETAFFSFDIPNGLGSWKSPTLKFVNNVPMEMDLASLDSINNSAIYFYQSPDGVSQQEVKIAPGGRQSSNDTVVSLALNPYKQGGETTLDILFMLLSLSGGDMLYSKAERPTQLVAKHSAIGMLVAILLLFSPLVRPWRAWSLWLARRSKKLAKELPDIDADVDMAEQALSHVSSRVLVTRKSGDPSGIRRYEPGDSLSQARRLDLLAFSSAGQKLGLHALPPKMKLREIYEGFELVILLDASYSLKFPWDSLNSRKIQMAKLVSELAIRSTSRLNARWRIALAQKPEKARGPYDKSQDVSLEIDKLLSSELSGKNKVGKERTLGELKSWGSSILVLFISDFQGGGRDQYFKYFGQASSLDMRISVIGLFDEEQKREVGSAVGYSTGISIDRSEWSQADILFELEALQVDLKEFFSQADLKYIEVNVDAGSSELAELIADQGLFEMGA
jgi:hypothetical protein